MAERQQSFIVSIPTSYDSDTREQIGEEIVQFIVNRTQEGLDRFNKPFPKYSPDYVKTFDFQVAGKKQSEPNLELSGDMLASLRVLSTAPGAIRIGWPEGSAENDKAAWVRRKERGGRDIMGIMPKDLNNILENYPEPSTENTGLFTSLANEVLRRISTR
jgi:hypothetical protein